MDKEQFQKKFEKAAIRACNFAQSMSTRTLPPSVKFNIDPINLSYGKSAPPGYIKFLGGKMMNPEQLNGLTLFQTVKLLWIDGKIPCWINLQVESIDNSCTYIRVRVCEETTNDDAKLYHNREGIPPFHILGLTVPVGWKSVKESGKINL